jgi:hypothetical protein
MKSLNQVLNPDQGRFYYYNGEKIPLKVVPEKMLITFTEQLESDQMAKSLTNIDKENFFINQGTSLKSDLPPSKFLLVNLYSQASNRLAGKSLEITEDPQIASVSEVFENVEKGSYLALTNQLFVKLKDGDKIDKIKDLLDSYGVIDQEDYMNGLYLLTLKDNNEQDALEVANALYESGKVEFADPNFFRKLFSFSLTPNDPYFPYEWHIPVIQADQAWCWTTGSAVKLGVIDVGINTSHPDLAAHVGGTYDPTGQPLGVDSHGTLCAGAALGIGNNGIGVAGVAFNAQLYAIRIGYNNTGDPNNNSFYSIDSWQVGAYNYASSNGVAIASCSFSLGSHSSSLDSAISSFATSGRGGLGGVIFAATGNNGNTSIGYPATHSDVIAVGATDQSDNVASFSNYGPKVDLTAPGVFIATTTYDGSYTTNFSGTSAATPITAACAALILANNPSLTRAQVLGGLGTYADKVGLNPYIGGSPSGGYPYGSKNQYMGYGRVNIYNYFLSIYNIVGPNNFCGSSQQYSFSNLPSGVTVTWSSSNPNLPVDSSGVVSNPSGNPDETILTATLSNGCTVVNKYVVAGAFGPEVYAFASNSYDSLNFNWAPADSGSYVLSVKNDTQATFSYNYLLFGYGPAIGKSTLYSPPPSGYNPPRITEISDTGWLPSAADTQSLQILSAPPGWISAGAAGPYIFFGAGADASGTLVVRVQTTCGYSDCTFNCVGY